MVVFSSLFVFRVVELRPHISSCPAVACHRTCASTHRPGSIYPSMDTYAIKVFASLRDVLNFFRENSVPISLLIGASFLQLKIYFDEKNMSRVMLNILAPTLTEALFLFHILVALKYIFKYEKDHTKISYKTGNRIGYAVQPVCQAWGSVYHASHLVHFY